MTMSRLHLGRPGAALLLLAASASVAYAQAITGAGSTFAAPIYGAWEDASKATTGISLNYAGNGSGAGQKLVTQRTVDFGGSDAPMPADKLAAAKLLQFPSVMGAVDVAVNLPGVADGALRLDGPTLAAIYLGTITNWNDPAIAKLNVGMKLPDLAIAPVYRADGSGTTYVFTSYLSKVSADFKTKVGADKAVSWPAGTGAKGTAGVAGAVRNTAGAVGYVESAYATLNHLTTTQLKSHDGNFIKPTLASFSAAARASGLDRRPQLCRGPQRPAGRRRLAYRFGHVRSRPNKPHGPGEECGRPEVFRLGLHEWRCYRKNSAVCGVAGECEDKGAGGLGAVEEVRPPFLQKRSKKLLSIGAVMLQPSRPNEQTFFGSFFQKRTLS